MTVVDTAGAAAAGIVAAGAGTDVTGSDNAAVAVGTGSELQYLGHIRPQSRLP